MLVHQEDRRLSLTNQLTSQERACKCTVDFHLQVTSLHFIPFGKARHCCTVLSLWHSRPAIVSLTQPPSAMHPASQDAHCGLCFALDAVSAQILLQGATHPAGQGCTLPFPILFVAQVLCSIELVLATRCHLIKINLVLFPITVLRSLSFLIPSYKNKCVILSCGTSSSNICLRSTWGVP